MFILSTPTSYGFQEDDNDERCNSTAVDTTSSGDGYHQRATHVNHTPRTHRRKEMAFVPGDNDVYTGPGL